MTQKDKELKWIDKEIQKVEAEIITGKDLFNTGKERLIMLALMKRQVRETPN